MSIKLSKGKKILFLVTIFLTNLIIGADLVLSPTIYAIYQMFPNYTALINFAVSGPYLIVVFAAPFAGKLINKFDAKKILITGGVMAAIGCIFVLFLENPYWLVAMRVLFGFGYAFTQVGGITLLAQTYSDEKKYGSVIGFYNASNTALTSITGLIAGYLAAIAIHMAYRVYWVMIPLILLEIFCVPNFNNVYKKDTTSLEEPVNKEEPTDTTKHKEGFGAKFWIMLINYGLMSVVGCGFTIFVSTYVIENGFGNEATVGLVNTAFSVAGALCGLIFGKVLAKFGRNLIVFLYAAFALNVALMRFYPSLAIAYIGFALLGVIYSAVMSFGFAYLPMIVSKARVNNAVSYVTTSTCLGSFLAPYAITISMGLLHTQLFTPSTSVLIVIAAVVTIIEILVGLKWKEVKTTSGM